MKAPYSERIHDDYAERGEVYTYRPRTQLVHHFDQEQFKHTYSLLTKRLIEHHGWGMIKGGHSDDATL